mgnify:CR=1 FL=1
MEIWQAILLGLTQGLTEFLPVSSSGHLAFFKGVMGLDVGLLFDITLHVGTLIAVCVVFWRDIIDLFRKPFHTLIYLIIATIPAGIVGLLLMDWSDEAIGGSPYIGILLAVFFTITAVLLFVTEIYAKRRKRTFPLSLRTTVPMGIAQAVAALFPGLSRSGSTICAGVLAGGRAEDLSKFSFLMSIPVILGSFAVSLVKSLADGSLEASFTAGGPQFGWCIAIGFIVSALSGLFAIKVMLGAIKKANYKWFSLYLILMAITCVVLYCFNLI